MGKNNFGSYEWKKTLISLAIGGGGAAAIYILQGLGEMDFGALTPAVVAIASVIISMLREYLKDNSDK